jgi:hypothetical protein
MLLHMGLNITALGAKANLSMLNDSNVKAPVTGLLLFRRQRNRKFI